MYRPLRAANLIIAFIATTAPMAHGLELVSKMTLNGPLWLRIQQNLYRGWGPVFGPVEILALVSTVALVIAARDPNARRAFIIAAICYSGMLACFFLFNAPVNAAINGWTPDTLPSDWSDYRLRWETGHALAAVFSVFAFATLLRSRIRCGSSESPTRFAAQSDLPARGR